MKKFILLILTVFAVNISISAQNKGAAGAIEVSREYYVENGIYLCGFEFVNHNKFEVQIDVDLFFNGDQTLFNYESTSKVESKSFQLKPKERYFWQCGEVMINHNGSQYMCHPEFFYIRCNVSKLKKK